MLGSPSPQPSSSVRAPRSARPAIARASASALGHSSAQYGRNSSRSNASSSSSASLSRGRSSRRSRPSTATTSSTRSVGSATAHRRGCIRDIARTDTRVTSVDVARRAGVSQSTVSLVLSGKSAGRISARTEAAVRAAAEELGYRPNVAARALRTGTARTVGLVVTDVTHPFFGPVLRGAQAPPGGPATRSRWSTSPTTPTASWPRSRRCAPARSTASCSSPSTRPRRPASTWSRSRCRRRGWRPSASTPSAAPSSRSAICSSSGTRASATSGPSSTPRPSGSGATIVSVLGEAGSSPALRARAVPVRGRAARCARAARRRGADDRRLLRRRPARRRRLPGGARARRADPRTTSPWSGSTTSLRAGLRAAPDHDPDRPRGARRRVVRGAGGADGRRAAAARPSAPAGRARDHPRRASDAAPPPATAAADADDRR